MNNLIKVYIPCAFYVIFNIVLSVIIAVLIVGSEPQKVGTVALDKDYSEYSHEEFKVILRENRERHNKNNSITNSLQNKGIIFQVLFWMFGVILFRKITYVYLSLSLFGLSLLLLLNVFSFIQFLIILVCMFTAILFIPKRG